MTDWSYNFIQQLPEFAPFICFNDDKPCTDTSPHGFHRHPPGTRWQHDQLLRRRRDESLGRAGAFDLADLSADAGFGRQVRIIDSIASYVLIRQMAQDLTKHPSTVWLSAELSGQRRPVTLTFDHPAGPAACGRVLYSTYHTREHSTSGTTFPGYCPGGAMLAQENVLEFLVFELGVHRPAGITR